MNKVLLVVLAFGVLTIGVKVSAESRERRSDDAGPLEVVVERLSQEVASFTAQLSSMSSKLDSLNSDLTTLRSRTDNLDRTTAFYAVNSNNPIQTTAGGTLIFDHAVTNVGDAYNTLTGVFTAPGPGLYHFQTTFASSNLGTGQHAYVHIIVDHTNTATGISDTQHGHNDQTTISTIVHLNAGQQVYVKNPSAAVEAYLGRSVTDPYTTFSGFLLHAD